MESEDDMIDDSVSMEDDFYSGDLSYCYDDDPNDNDNDYYFDDDNDYGLLEDDDDDDQDAIVSRRPQLSYTVLKEADIKQQQEDDISKFSETCFPEHGWHSRSVSKVHDEWFADEGGVRQSVGLLERPAVQVSNARELTCGICFESFLRDNITSVACGHPFCLSCWRGYISTTIYDGPGCLSLRCPDPSCNAAVGKDMIDKLATSEEKEKYSRYLLRSYVEDNRKTKWCPAPGCEYAVDFTVGSGNFDVSCNCSYSFCWNCTEEAHRPVDCETVAKWILKNSAESENMNWILANSKPCPKCKRPIEKNQG
ncbi:hypothetical protein Gorai_015927, partial [Gossypium raimondii]|nr:hypothetical protein [Gossypium raimondii]